MGYQITKKITKHNQTFLTLSGQGGIQHSTGNGEDTALGNFEYFNAADRMANAHFFVDAGNILQFVELDQVAYHARNPANSHVWGIEACETTDKTKFLQIWDNLVWLWAHLFTEVASPRIYSITSDTLRSHDEENRLNHPGDSSNHNDPTAYFRKFGKSMDLLRLDVQNRINTILIEKVLGNTYLIGVQDYWRENCQPGHNINGDWAGMVIKKFVAMFKKCDTFDECIEWLRDNEMINSPQLWKDNAVQGRTVAGANMRYLLIAMGKKL